MDPIASFLSFFNEVIPFLPARWAAALSVVGSFLVSTCALMAFFWPRPSSTSKWLPVYLVINTVGLNGRHAQNAPSPRDKKLEN